MEAAERDFVVSPLSAGEATRVADWLLTHRNTGGGFVFPLTPQERRERPPLLSGEKPKTFLLAENALECESLRLLAKAAPGSPEAAQISPAADRRLSKQCFASVCTTGECPMFHRLS
jgi:hypothetical protein